MNKFKKILASFSFGLLLSIIPVTAFAASGKSFSLKKMFLAGCDPVLNFNLILDGLGGIPFTIHCDLVGESGDAHVQVCAYICSTM